MDALVIMNNEAWVKKNRSKSNLKFFVGPTPKKANNFFENSFFLDLFSPLRALVKTSERHLVCS